MTLYINNLYTHIIQREAPNSTHLRVISGYGSASFLEKVANEFPNLKIQLFLGMTSQGISVRNHEGYRTLMKRNTNIQVYYQINEVPNHMKVLEFSSETQSTAFIGSANFTENGFVTQREIMTQVTDSLASLFKYQLEVSVECTKDAIEKLLIIFSDENFSKVKNEISNVEDSNNVENTMTLVEVNKIDIDDLEYQKQTQRIRDLRSQANPEYYHTFNLEIVLDSKYNPRWNSTGINSWTENKIPVLEQTSKILFDKLFPIDNNFQVYADDGHVYIGELTGRFNGNFKLVNGNLYDYVRNHIGIKEYRPISREDLQSYGDTRLHFERLDENLYSMCFGLID